MQTKTRLHRCKRYFMAMLPAVLFLLTAKPAWAVPAAPGTGRTGADAACHSHTEGLLAAEPSPDAVEEAAPDEAEEAAPDAAEETPDQPEDAIPELPESVFSINSLPGVNLASEHKSIPLVMIVVGLNDMAYDAEFDWADTIFGSGRSLREYYLDMSFGQFTFDPADETYAFDPGDAGAAEPPCRDAAGDGIIHVTLDRAHAPGGWTTQSDPDEVDDLLGLISEAVTEAGAYIDYGAYDADGDGRISPDELAVGLIVAGYEASASDASYPAGIGNYLWAHAWSIGEAARDMGLERGEPEVNGVRVSSYIAMAEYLDSDGTEQPKQASIGTLAHELGHYFGLPDLYDTNPNRRDNTAWSGYQVGYLSLMDTGCWGIDPAGDYVPYSLDVWSRTVLGWVDPERARTCGRYDAVSQTFSGDDTETFRALQIPMERGDEYYLLENRQFVKWDEGMPAVYPAADQAAGGLILWHIDEDIDRQYREKNAVNNADHPPAVMPLFLAEDDGSASLSGRDTDPARPFFPSDGWQSSETAAADDKELLLPAYVSGAAVETETGIRFLTGSAQTMTVQLHTKNHVPGEAVTEHEIPAGSRTDGSYELAVYCEICGEEISREKVVIPATGEEDGPEEQPGTTDTPGDGSGGTGTPQDTPGDDSDGTEVPHEAPGGGSDGTDTPQDTSGEEPAPEQASGERPDDIEAVTPDAGSVQYAQNISSGSSDRAKQASGDPQSIRATALHGAETGDESKLIYWSALLVIAGLPAGILAAKGRAGRRRKRR